MQLELTEEERAFRDELRDFFTTKVPQDIRDTVAAGRELTKDQLVESMQTLNAAGYAVPRWPVEWGGQDWTEIQFHIWHAEMERACVPTPARLQRQHDRPGHRAVRHRGAEEGVPAQDREHRHLLVARASPSPTPAPTWPAAHHRGQGRRRLGRQRPEDLDHARPVRRLDLHAGPHRPRAKKQAGISMLLIDMEAEGLEVRPIQLIDGGHEVNEVWFEDVRVPGANLVGELNGGWSIAKFLLGNERVGVAPPGSPSGCRPGQGAGRGPVRRRPAAAGQDRRARERAARPRADDDAGRRQLRRGQAAPRLVGAQAQGQRAPAGGQRAGARPGRPGRAGQRRRASDSDLTEWERLAGPLYLNLRKASIYGGSNEVQRQIIARNILGL